MSIIYDALKKVEGQKASPSSENIPVGINLPVQKKETKGNFGKKVFIPLLLILIFSGFLLFERKSKIDPGRVYRNPEPKSKVFEEAALNEEPIKEYILEGIIYDQKASSAVINGKLIKESDKLGVFQINKISEDKVEMSNTEDNSKVILSLPY